MTLRLHSIQFTVSPKIPGLRAGALTTVECDNPHGLLVDWKISVRGQSIFFISPPGWSPRNATDRARERDPKGPIQVFEIPRADATLSWTADAQELENVLKSVKYDSEPLRPLAPVIEQSEDAGIPAHQLGD